MAEESNAKENKDDEKRQIKNNEKGQIIAGDFSKIIIRQKAEKSLELGELVTAKSGNGKIVMQINDLSYGSQLSQQNIELASGMVLEENAKIDFFDPELRNYRLAYAKSLIYIKGSSAKSCKRIPDFFSFVYEIDKEDLSFISFPENSLYLGELRSGSKVIGLKIEIDGKKSLAEHLLICASTGKGKSNLAKCIAFDILGKSYAGLLILDPHDEYYGRNSLGLKDHPLKESLAYYSPNPVVGTKTLKINIKSIKPEHLNGAISLSLPQKEAINAYYRKFKENWISAVIFEEKTGFSFNEGTLAVIRRRLSSLFSIGIANNRLFSSGIFSIDSGESTINDICSELEAGKNVIIDSSGLSGSVEILIGSVICTEIFRRYKGYKLKGKLKDMPNISVLIEEAPRVIGKEALQEGQNIFSTIAREGRKFKIGLIAITQLPSLIPRQILANMNTKIILGLEMAPERQAIIESASQDLSSDSRSIASLDKGEAIVTSTFTKFAIPIKIPLFRDFVIETQNKHNKIKHLKAKSQAKETETAFEGIKLS